MHASAQNKDKMMACEEIEGGIFKRNEGVARPASALGGERSAFCRLLETLLCLDRPSEERRCRGRKSRRKKEGLDFIRRGDAPVLKWRPRVAVAALVMPRTKTCCVHATALSET